MEGYLIDENIPPKKFRVPKLGNLLSTPLKTVWTRLFVKILFLEHFSYINTKEIYHILMKRMTANYSVSVIEILADYSRVISHISQTEMKIIL